MAMLETSQSGTQRKNKRKCSVQREARQARCSHKRRAKETHGESPTNTKNAMEAQRVVTAELVIHMLYPLETGVTCTGIAVKPLNAGVQEKCCSVTTETEV